MEIPRHWRLKAQRYRMEGSTCPTCGQFMFPPRPICAKRQCNSQRMQIVGEAFPLLISNRLTDTKLHLVYQITERVIG